jgi:hypothetical protein
MPAPVKFPSLKAKISCYDKSLNGNLINYRNLFFDFVIGFVMTPIAIVVICSLHILNDAAKEEKGVCSELSTVKMNAPVVCLHAYVLF